MQKPTSPEDSGTATEQQSDCSEILSDTSPLTSLSLNQRCSDAYWFLDTSHTLTSSTRMAAAIQVIADEVERWSEDCEAKGATIVALAIKGVAERLRDRANA